jgi:membrane-associated phospholipid phosphatase
MDDLPAVTPDRCAALAAPQIQRLTFAVVHASIGRAGPRLMRYGVPPDALDVVGQLRTGLAAGPVSAAGLAAVYRYRDADEVRRGLGTLAAAKIIEEADDGAICATGTGRALLAMMYAAGAEAAAELWSGHRDTVAELSELAGRLVAAAAATGGDAYAALAPPYEPPGASAGLLLHHRLAVLRYHRADAHAAAWQALVFALAVGFTYLLDSVLDGDGIAVIDRPAARWVAGHRDGWLTAAMRVITHAGDPVTVGVLAAVAYAGVAWWRRSWLPHALGVLGAGGIGLVVTGAKLVAGRSRPPLPFAAAAEEGYSFPSGHAAGIMVLVLLSAWMLTWWVIRSRNGRVLAWTTAAVLVGVVGFSRVYLGVHYLSDVAAGWLLGAAWAGTVALACGWWEAARGTARTPRARQAAAGSGPGGLACEPGPEQSLDAHPVGGSGRSAHASSRLGRR